jgi:hypothetical protein
MRTRALWLVAAAATTLALLVPTASGRLDLDGGGTICIDTGVVNVLFSHKLIGDPGTGCGTTDTTTYDWGVSPDYTGSYFTDTASADAAEPPPPAPAPAPPAAPPAPAPAPVVPRAAGRG